MLRKSSLSACPPPNSSDISIGFSYDDLERFLLSSVALYCNDTELAALARTAASGLANQWQTQGIESFPDDVSNVANILDAFIAMTSRSGATNNNQNDSRSSNRTNNTRPLPAHVVYEVHSFMGLLNLAQKNESAAKVSFMKALWITAAMSVDPLSKQQHQGNGGGSHELALTLHRLGKIHARCAVTSSKSSSSSSSSSTKASYDEAKSLLTRAIQEYEKKTAPGGGKDHYLLLDAKSELQQMERQRRKQLMEEGTRSSILSSRGMMHQSLPFILEEGDSIEPTAERRRSSAI